MIRDGIFAVFMLAALYGALHELPAVAERVNATLEGAMK